MGLKTDKKSWRDFRRDAKKYKQEYSDPSQLGGEPWCSIKYKKKWRK
jgi:hypothetical protein